MDEGTCVVRIPSYVTKQDEGSKDSYTAYQIVITMQGQEWRTAVRYSTFRLLHDAVKRRFPSIRLPKLPPKKLMGNDKGEFLDRRRNELELYLRELLSVPLIRASEEVCRVLELSSRIDPSASPVSARSPSPHTPTQLTLSPRTRDSHHEDVNSATSSARSSESYDSPGTKQAVAVYEFAGDYDQNQLSFKVGDVIVILSDDDPDGSGWWWGEKDGVQGYFPASYIRVVEKRKSQPQEPARPEPEKAKEAEAPPKEETPESPSTGRLASLYGQTTNMSNQPSPAPAVRPKLDVSNKKAPPPVPGRSVTVGANHSSTTTTTSPTLPTVSGAGFSYMPGAGAPPSATASHYGLAKPNQGTPTPPRRPGIPGVVMPAISQEQLASRLARSTGDAQKSPRQAGPPATPGGSQIDPTSRPAIPPRARPGATPVGLTSSNQEVNAHSGSPGNPESAPATPPAEKKDKRTMIANEILSTERTYVEGLKWLIEEYKQALVKLSTEGHGAITDAIIKRIFSNVEIIRNLNQTLMNDLEKRLTTWDVEKTLIGDLFTKLAPYLKMYKDYSNNFETASETCQQIREHHAISSALDSIKSKCQSLSIEALLITPIQRLPRYNLLIEDLLRNTPDSHPDHQNLVDALKSTKEIADYINESIRQAEQSAKFRNLATQGEQFRRLLEAHRTLVMEGKVTLAERRSKSQWVICLFNDVIVPAKLQRAEIIPQLTVPLNLTWLNPDVKGAKDPSFEIVTPERIFNFVVATAQERQNWIKAIGDGINNNIQNKSENDLTKRQGSYSYSTGGEYSGQWQLGKRHGTGRLEYFNGNVYEGTWKEDMRHGKGTFTYCTGEVYQGDWLNDKKEGQGTLKYTNGTTYVGLWKDGMRDGAGTITFANGDVFEGKFIGDKAHGKGRLEYRNGYVFDGFFEDDRRHGLGMLKSVDGKRYYHGNWVYGRKEGNGTMVYGNGCMYDGSWHDDKRHGAGKFVDEDGSEYVGDWARDMKEGKGTYVANNGDVYEGHWKEDKRNGHGVLVTKEGHKYEGEFVNGRKQGKGVISYANGEKYEGTWLNDRPHGNGVWTASDGSKFDGKWTNGARDGKCSVTPPSKSKDNVFHGVCKDNAVTGTGDKVFELAPTAPDINLL